MQAELRHRRLSAIMAAMNQSPQNAWPFNPNFPKLISLVELANDNGFGQILRPYKELLLAAEKWAEQDYDYQERHEDPKRLPVTNPWKFLLDAPAVSPSHKTVFRAAQSQLPALRHLIHMAEGIATLKTDWYQKAIESRAKRDKRPYKHAMRKVADVRALNPHFQEDVRAQNDPELLKSMELVRKNRCRQLVKRSDRGEIDNPKTWTELWTEFRKDNSLPMLLVEWWVHCGGNDLPGLMFWRNEALTKFLKVHLDNSNRITAPNVKKIRQQLGLIPVGDKKHFVWDVSFTTNQGGNREIKGLWRNGQQPFRVGISPQKKISAAVMTAFKSF